MAVLFLVTVILSFSVSAKENGKLLRTPPHANPDIIRGIECLYNWKFEKAGEFFERIIRKNPHEPAGYFYRSMVIWSRMAAGFWSAETIEEYNNSIELTISVAKERIERDKADSTAYFYLGGALGFKGRLQLMQHKFFSSYLVSLLDELELLYGSSLSSMEKLLQQRSSLIGIPAGPKALVL